MKKDLKRAITSQCMLCFITLLPAVLLVPFTPSAAQVSGKVPSADTSMPEASAQSGHAKEAIAEDTPAIQSMEEADRLLSEASQKRSAINQTFLEEERLCRERFFVASCLEDAKERRRVALKPLRSMEVRANTFKRYYKAEQRSKALEKKRLKEQTPAERIGDQGEAGHEEYGRDPEVGRASVQSASSPQKTWHDKANAAASLNSEKDTDEIVLQGKDGRQSKHTDLEASGFGKVRQTYASSDARSYARSLREEASAARINVEPKVMMP
jgi:hypothetical protein